MEVSAEKIYSIIADRLPRFERSGTLEPLEEGHLNHVWRLKGKERNLIIKYAPPHIASNPEVPLSSARIEFEARALNLFGPSNLLQGLASSKIRPPALWHFSRDHSLLFMEDLGELPGLDSGLNQRSRLAADDFGKMLGSFIGRIHKKTYRLSELKSRFDNRDIQKTRHDVQYLPAADYAAGINKTDNDLLRARTEALGEKLLQPGRCLVMGDLWPPSVLVDGNDHLRLIDWEFVHYGRPLQDVGHFAAHCWMQAHTASSTEQARQWKQLWLLFWKTYQDTTGDLFPDLFDRAEFTGMYVHIGAEILIRTAGPFKTGYVYQDFNSTHSRIKEAVTNAIQMIVGEPENFRDHFPVTG